MARVFAFVWLVLLLALVSGGQAHAYGVVTGSQGTPVNEYHFAWLWSGAWYSTKTAACDSYVGVVDSGVTIVARHNTPNPEGGTCALRYCNNASLENGSCSASTGYGQTSAGALSTRQFTPTVCPSGSKKDSTSRCICDKGFKPNGSTSCQPMTCGAAGSYGVQTAPDIEVSSKDTMQCINGCRVTARSVSADSTGKLWAQWPFVSMGANAFCGGLDTGDQVANEPRDTDGRTGPQGQAPLACGMGEFAGQVNGADVCVKGIGPVVTSVETFTGENGASVREVTECTSSQCVTRTYVNDGTDADWTRVSTSTVVGGSGVGVVGSPNGGSGSGQGTGGGGEETPEENPCDQNPNSAACAGFGEAPEAPELPASSATLGWAAGHEFGPSSSACPAPRSVTLAHGFQLSMPFDLLCQFADGIRPVLIGLAWLSAVLAFIGFGRKES